MLKEILPEFPPFLPVHLLGIGDMQSLDLLKDQPIDTYDSCNLLCT